MNMCEQMISIAQLEQMFNGNPQTRIHLAVARYRTYDEFVKIVHDVIDIIFRSYEENPKYKNNMGEDELTMMLIENMKSYGLTAMHDAMSGGHCDIVVKGRDDFTWLGEAKIHRSYDWLFKGFQQLDTRYMAPAEYRDHGGMIIYCYVKRADTVFKNWIEHLSCTRTDVVIDHYDSDKIRCVTSHVHERNGRTVKIWHAIAALHFSPQDKN
ncbi:hypothetical protein [Insolitispirillum peregrinum]|uniref:Uncharacterized protein n=1 Tax=Insolitispirillum peregrinum TaxID=80876 RepID=A0A1N7PL65_9PROT|nr:hypothetical protein [Insolitispirillum peregrinum]SIT11364.1 hypothetical protein SAMN05421779_10758 [Insolitispirillum peregrinum]